MSEGNGRVAVRAERAFDGERRVRGGVLVLCEAGRIVALEPAGAGPPDGWAVHDFGAATVLPGLIDAHVHLCGDSRNGALDRLPGLGADEVEQVIDDALAAQLAAGVTTVRDLGDRSWAALDRRDRGDDRTPTVVASGPPITTRKGHCWPMGGEAETTAEISAAVRERAERRVDVVKVMTSGGAMTGGTDVLECQYDLDQLRRVVDEAHAAGLPVTAHAHGLPAVELSVAARVDGIEHCSCFTPNGIHAPTRLVERLAASGIVVCPTLGHRRDVDIPPNVVAMMERTGTSPKARAAFAAQLVEAGVTVISGVDAGISAGKAHGALPSAMAALVEGGASTTVALATANVVGGARLGLEGRKGVLRAGADADLLVVDGDPLDDIGALDQVRAVFLGGRSC